MSRAFYLLLIGIAARRSRFGGFEARILERATVRVKCLTQEHNSTGWSYH